MPAQCCRAALTADSAQAPNVADANHVSMPRRNAQPDLRTFNHGPGKASAEGCCHLRTRLRLLFPAMKSTVSIFARRAASKPGTSSYRLSRHHARRTLVRRASRRRYDTAVTSGSSKPPGRPGFTACRSTASHYTVWVANARRTDFSPLSAERWSGPWNSESRRRPVCGSPSGSRAQGKGVTLLITSSS